MKRILIVLLCMAIGLSTVGCAKGNNSSGSPTGSSTGNIGTIGADTEDDIFPLSEEKITIKIMATRWTNQGPFEDYAFTKAYEELTNVHVEWIEATSAEGGKLKTLAFQSGDMPDAMCLMDTTVNDIDIHTYSKQGVIAELNDLIDEYAPNVKKLLDSRPDARAACTNADGKIYSLPLISQQEAYNEEAMMYIRKSWLENLGLEMPKTSQDFYNILTAFKNDDPNGNGKQDEIAFAATSGLSMWMWSPWGINTWYNRHYMAINDQGKIYYAPITDSMKNAVTFYRNLYNADLMSQDIFEGSAVALKKVVQQGLVGVFGGVDLETYLGQDLCEDYTPMPFFNSGYQAEFNGKATMATKSAAAKHTFLISEKSKHKELIMKWYDYLCTQEGSLLRTYGPEGDGYYEMTEDGKVKILDPSIDANLTRGPSWVIGSTPERIELAPKDNMTWQEKWNVDILGFDNLKKLYGDQLAEKNIGSLFFTEDEAYAITNLGDTYGQTYWQLSEFITGARNIDTEWNTYVEDVVRKGVNDTIAIYQTAYDRQNKTK